MVLTGKPPKHTPSVSERPAVSPHRGSGLRPPASARLPRFPSAPEPGSLGKSEAIQSNFKVSHCGTVRDRIAPCRPHRPLARRKHSTAPSSNLTDPCNSVIHNLTSSQLHRLCTAHLHFFSTVVFFTSLASPCQLARRISLGLPTLLQF